MTDALIIGGGVAGATTALGLHQAGFTVRLVEAHEQGGADRGAFLTIMPNGRDALAAIGVADTVAAAGFPAVTTHAMNLATGESTQHLAGNRRGLTTITRAGLYETLQQEARCRGIRDEHGKRYRNSARTSEGGVRASFDDGSTAEARFLVGADGIGSTVRTEIDPHNPDPSRANVLVVYGAAPNTAAVAPEQYRFVRGPGFTFSGTTDPHGTTWWFLRVAPEYTRLADPTAASQQDWKTEALRVTARESTLAARLIEASPTVLAIDVHHLPSVPTWHTDTTVLAGDAAHAASPSAQGASMAAEDGVLLAKCLRDSPTRNTCSAGTNTSGDGAPKGSSRAEPSKEQGGAPQCPPIRTNTTSTGTTQSPRTRPPTRWRTGRPGPDCAVAGIS